MGPGRQLVSSTRITAALLFPISSQSAYGILYVSYELYFALLQCVLNPSVHNQYVELMEFVSLKKGHSDSYLVRTFCNL